MNNVRLFLQRLVRRLIPVRWRDRAKAIVSSAGAVLQIVNALVPDYSDKFKLAVGFLIAVLTYLGVYDVPNVPVDDAARGRGIPPAYARP